jgi:outer membrane protein assembly factor BamB
MRRDSAIRELAASTASTRLAAALFERTVQIWDVKSGERIAEFDTVYSFGGRRLTIDASGELCVAAGWTRGRRGGVACYETRSGKLLWHRSDLGQTQHVRFLARGKSVWRVPETGPTSQLDALTGNTLEEIRGLRGIYDSAYDNALPLEKQKGDYVLRTRKDLRLPRLDFSILDAAFGPDALCVCEAGNDLARCFDISTGAERWRCDAFKRNCIVRFWHRAVDDTFYGVQWEYERGRPRILVRFERESGRPEGLCQIDSSSHETVSPTLDCLITSAESVFGLSDGSLTNCLAFPEREYPE